jgi:hypothetical protein
MPEPAVRQALLVSYLTFGLVPVVALGFCRKGARAAADILTLTSLLLLAGSVFTYPQAVGVYLAVVGTAAGAAAVVLAWRILIGAATAIPRRRPINYLLVVLPVTLVVVVAETVLWPSDRYNLTRLAAVCLCGAALWAGIRLCRGLPGRFVILGIVYATVGLLLASFAEILRLFGTPQYVLAAKALQGFGARFLGYFGAGMSLACLPNVANGPKTQGSTAPSLQQD